MANPLSARERNFFARMLTPLNFGARGDGITNDTEAWAEFQAAPGQMKAVPAGRYLVNGEVKRFDQGCIGNGEFDDTTSAWDQPRGDRERDSILVHRRDINVNGTVVSPAIKTQTHTNWLRGTPAGSFKHVLGAYHEGTWDGYYNTQTEGNNNFTVAGSAVLNRMAGLFGGLAHLAYCEDVDETFNPLISTMGASKNGCSFLRFTRRAKHEHGGYMFGLEVFAVNSADEPLAIPYQNNDNFGFTSWTSAAKFTASADGAPISAAMFTSGHSNKKHGFWNGIVLGGSSFRINDNAQGAPGTVGLNLASWNEGQYGDIGIKFRRANRHLWFREGAKIQSPTTRFMNQDGSCGLTIESSAADQATFLRFRTNTDASFSPSATSMSEIDANNTQLSIKQITGGNGAQIVLQAGPDSGANTQVVVTTARLAPSEGQDNTKALGAANRRWSEVFAGNGTISTSDERAKQDIQALSDAETRVANACKGLVRKYRMRDAVAKKEDAARWHFGVIAQDVVAAFAEEGLDAHQYGVLCYDKWEAKDEIVNITRTSIKPPVYEQVLVAPEQEVVIADAKYDADGNLVAPAETTTQEAVYRDGDIIEPEQFEETRTVIPAVEAGDRYGIRYEEMLAFIIAAM